MTDRGTGVVWALLNAPDTEHIKLVSPPPSAFRGEAYGAYEGPWIDTGTESIRLLVRDGALGYDRPGFRVRSRPIFAPDRVQASTKNIFYRVVVPEGFQFGDALAYLIGVDP